MSPISPVFPGSPWAKSHFVRKIEAVVRSNWPSKRSASVSMKGLRSSKRCLVIRFIGKSRKNRPPHQGGPPPPAGGGRYRKESPAPGWVLLFSGTLRRWGGRYNAGKAKSVVKKNAKRKNWPTQCRPASLFVVSSPGGLAAPRCRLPAAAGSYAPRSSRVSGLSRSARSTGFGRRV